MSVANRILNVLVLLAAIGAIVLTIMLFNKREEVVQGRNDMAQAISDNSNKMAETSTEDPGDVKIEAEEMAVKAGPGGVSNALKKFDDVTSAIIAQRDELAEQIVALAAIIAEHNAEAGEYSEYKGSELANVQTNKAKFEEIKEKTAKTIALYKQTREAYIQAFKDLEEALEMDSIGEEALDPKNPDFEKIGVQLKVMDQKIKAIYSQVTGVNDLVPAAFKASGDLKGMNYVDFLSTQKNLVQAFATDYARLAKEVEELTAKVEELTAVIEKQTAEIEKLEAEKDKLKADFETERNAKEKLQAELNLLKEEATKLKKKVKDAEQMGISSVASAGQVAAPTKAQVSAQASTLSKVEGKIIYVNKESGFVSIDIGTKSKVDVKNAQGKKVAVPVVLPANAIMTVAKSLNPSTAGFVAKIQVYKVDEFISMANVVDGDLPSVGDVVYFSATDITNSLPAGK